MRVNMEVPIMLVYLLAVWVPQTQAEPNGSKCFLINDAVSLVDFGI